MAYDERRFGRLTVIGDTTRSRNIRMVLCECACGSNHVAALADLRRGHTRSCGCIKAEAMAAKGRAKGTHRRTHSSLYWTWRAIKARCSNPASKDYRCYGARGIVLYAPWSDSFEAFAAYIDGVLGSRPQGQQLDRVNNDGNYEPDNLRWATRSQQMVNRRPFRRVRRRVLPCVTEVSCHV